MKTTGKLKGLETEIIAHYKSGINTTALAKNYGVFPASIRQVLRKHNIDLRGADPAKILSKEQEVKDLYLSGLGAKKVAEQLGLATMTVFYFLKEQNLLRSASVANRKYSIDETVFDKIDSEEKAYWLGFLYADGCHFRGKYRISLELQRRDLYMIEKFRELLKYTGPIKETYGKTKGSHCNALSIQNVRISDNMLKWGMRPGKTFDIDFPNWLPEPLLAHFVRGFFDGDGTLGMYAARKDNITSKSFTAGFVGHIRMMKQLSEYLNEKLGVSFDLRLAHKGGHPDIFKAMLSGRANVLKLLNYMYEGATIYLDRKRDKYLEMLAVEQLYLLNPRGENRLSVKQVEEIKQLLDSGKTCTQVGKLLGLNRDLVGNIKSGKSWASVTGYTDYSPKKRLTPEQVREVVSRLNNGTGAVKIAAQFGVALVTIHYIRRGVYRNADSGLDFVEAKSDLKGENNPNSILNNEMVLTIKKMLADGLLPKAITEKTGVNIGSIYDIRLGRSWKHVTLP